VQAHFAAGTGTVHQKKPFCLYNDCAGHEVGVIPYRRTYVCLRPGLLLRTYKTCFESCQASGFTALRSLMKVIVIFGMMPCIITRFLQVFTAFTFGCNGKNSVFFLELEPVNTYVTLLPV
jgi:hypothetical protein